MWRLQRGSEADCLLFQRWSNGGKRITDRGTRQGFWVFTPSGQVLGRINTRSSERVLAMLDEALERWRSLPPSARQLAGDVIDPEHRWEQGYPAGGLALERFSRDLASAPEPATGAAAAPGWTPLDATPSNRWNLDTLWCSADEVRALLPQDAQVGDTFELPLLAERLARFALVDDAHGQALPFAPREVRHARLIARVVARTGVRAELELEGSTDAAAGETWLLGESPWKPKHVLPHAMRTRLLGTAVADLERGRFETFELTASAVRSGRTQFNGRRKDVEPSAVGYHFAPTQSRIPPTFAGAYGVDWIPQPEVAPWRDSPAECGLETAEAR